MKKKIFIFLIAFCMISIASCMLNACSQKENSFQDKKQTEIIQDDSQQEKEGETLNPSENKGGLKNGGTFLGN